MHVWEGKELGRECFGGPSHRGDQDGPGEVGEVHLLAVPGPAVVALQMLELLQARVACEGERGNGAEIKG